MRNTMLCISALVALCGASLSAQGIAGDWQGTIKPAATERRMVLKIRKDETSGWKGRLYFLDQGTEGIVIDSVMLQGSDLKVTLSAGTFDGKVSAKGATINGTWTQQGRPLPLNLTRATKATAWQVDASPHTVQFITVDKNVQLEVLDWGGTGRPLVMLAGLGNLAHVFDKLAPKLTDSYHVYGITRRGFGASSMPASGYGADRLADDVLAVLDSLKLVKPVIAGHSIAGEELSSIASRHPERVSGLIYLDAGYPYAFYDRAHGNYPIDLIALRQKLELLQAAAINADETRRLTHELLETDLPAFEKILRENEKNFPPLTAKRPAPPPPSPMMRVALAVLAGEQKYTDIRVPVLAIYALPHTVPAQLAGDSIARAAYLASEATTGRIQPDAFEHGIPSARVVRIPNADHFVFNSNEAEVLKEMRQFIDGLPRN